jgi:hypothetical protein
MNRLFPLAGPLFLGLAAMGVSAAAEQPAATPVTVEYYYKLIPGGTSEWKSLYLKNHFPILQQLMKEGILKSINVYERRFHAAKPAWDYKVVLVFRDWQALEQAREREPEIIRSLYPNKDLHDREENRRWEVTLEHWDDVLSPVALE